MSHRQRLDTSAHALIAESWTFARAHPVMASVAAGLVALQCGSAVYRRMRRRTEQGRRVLCTGAGSGIGRELAKKLAAKGWIVYALDINEQAVNSLAAEVGAAIHPVVCSIADKDQVKSAVDAIAKRETRLDALVNVAGMLGIGAAGWQTEEELMLMFQVNAMGTIRLCRDCLPLLLKAERGANIVNVTSIGGKVAWPWTGCYSAAKGAIELFTDGLRRETYMAGLNLRVSVVAPGAVSTPLAAAFPVKMKKHVEATTDSPFHARMASMIAFLTSNQQLDYLVSLDPGTVADAIVAVLEAHAPAARYVVMHPLFAPIYYLPLYLPAGLGDFFVRMLNP